MNEDLIRDNRVNLDMEIIKNELWETIKANLSVNEYNLICAVFKEGLTLTDESDRITLDNALIKLAGIIDRDYLEVIE